MGAFYLHHKSSNINIEGLLQHYDNLGFKLPYITEIGDYRLYLYEKQLINVKNYANQNSGSIYACGSLFYKSLGYLDSLRELLNDYLKSDLSTDHLYGNYIIIFKNSISSNISLLFDQAFIKNVYIDKNRKIISSHLLSIKSSETQNYTINESALIENIVTGQLISPDTYFNEIVRVDKKNYTDIPECFPGIRAIPFEIIPEKKFKNKKQSIDHANHNLGNYFDSATKICNEYGAHIGLTGGFDSRLLLMHARKKLDKLNTNSFWRENSSEYINAKKLAEQAQINFNSFENDPFQMPEMNGQLQKAYLFFDGQIRSQNYWIEEFNNPDYSCKLANNYLLGFHGCGGEQYRNSDRFTGKISLRKYILNEWIYKNCDIPFIDKKVEKFIYNIIEEKINRLTDNKSNYVDLLLLKRIQNEVWNISNRTTRVNVLNQQMFYFAPFTEATISYTAYQYVPFLGRSMNFQKEMMQDLDPELCKIMTNYGFRISDGEPLFKQLLSFGAGILPRSLVLKMHSKIRKLNQNNIALESTQKESKNFEDSFNKILDFKSISKNIDLQKNLVSFYFLYNQFNNRR